MADEKKTDAGVDAADKHRRTTASRGNGGKDENPGLITGKHGLDRIGGNSEFAENATVRPTDIGERETVSPGDIDKVYTADSKDRWENDQPSLTDQLAASRKNEERLMKEDRKNR